MRLNTQRIFRLRRERGWTIVVVLIVLVIIIILYATQFRSFNQPNSPTSRALDNAAENLAVRQDQVDNVTTSTPRQEQKVYHSEIGGMLNNVQRIRNIQTGLNTKTLNENLVLWKLNHPDLEVTLENLRNNNFPMPMLKPNQEYYIHENAIRIRNKN